MWCEAQVQHDFAVFLDFALFFYNKVMYTYVIC